MSEENLVCAVCQESSSLRCGRCRRIAYCSKEHQRLDWKIHKKSCGPFASKCFEIAINKTLGRYLVAARDIAEGEIVLEEAPLVMGPMHLTPPVCLGCYKLLNRFNSRNCSRCNWPVCSLECESSIAHKPECEITTKFKKEKVTITNFEREHPSYQCITVLRSLYLKKTNRVAWEKVTKLESHSEERKKSERFNTDVLMVAQFIPRFFNYHEFSQEDILKIVGIIEVNAHLVPLQVPGFVAVYNEGSLMEHSCVPNCSKTFSDDGKIIISAGRIIKKGEHLSITYTEPLWGIVDRQHHLFSSKYFVCKCDRCSDPTEFGTHFNSFKCPASECNGYIVPHTTSIPVHYTWRCIDCGAFLSEDHMLYIFDIVKKGLSNLNKTNPESVKEFLMEHKKYLHPNHFYMVNTKLDLIRYYQQEEILCASDEDLNYLVDIYKNFIDLGSKLAPAENRLQGILRLGLHSALSELWRRKSLSGEMDDSQLKQNLLICKDLLEKAFSYLKIEPQALEEGKMAIAAMERIHNINNFMRTTKLF